MSTVSRTFTVTTPPGVVVPYLADFANAEQWDPGTQTCVPNGPGPVAVGSSWHNTSKIAGVSSELTYTLEKLTDRQIVLVGRNKTATSTETIDVSPAGGGSQIIYTNETIFNGLAKLATPLVKIIFEKIGKDTEEQMVKRLNAL